MKVTGQSVKVKAMPFSKYQARLVTYSDITKGWLCLSNIYVLKLGFFAKKPHH